VHNAFDAASNESDSSHFNDWNDLKSCSLLVFFEIIYCNFLIFNQVRQGFKSRKALIGKGCEFQALGRMHWFWIFCSCTQGKNGKTLFIGSLLSIEIISNFKLFSPILAISRKLSIAHVAACTANPTCSATLTLIDLKLTPTSRPATSEGESEKLPPTWNFQKQI